MNVDELFEKVSQEPPREVRIEQALRVTENGRFEVTSGGRVVVKRLGHVLGPPAAQAALLGWHERWPRHPLPADLTALLARANGIHLWADLDTGRAPQGIAPLEEWNLARTTMFGEGSDPALLPDRHIALSYDENGASFVVLDVASGRYFLMDTAGPDETCPIGSAVEELLDWIWASRIGPDAYGG